VPQSDEDWSHRCGRCHLRAAFERAASAGGDAHGDREDTANITRTGLADDGRRPADDGPQTHAAANRATEGSYARGSSSSRCRSFRAANTIGIEAMPRTRPALLVLAFSIGGTGYIWLQDALHTVMPAVPAVDAAAIFVDATPVEVALLRQTAYGGGAEAVVNLTPSGMRGGSACSSPL
jgi:hypothetical protein